MLSRLVVLALVLSLAGLALGELPLTVTVGHQDGGVIGFQTKSNPPFFLATTSTGALVLNSSPRDTIIEWTVPANAAARVSLVEAHDEFGVTNATSTRPKSSFSPRKPLPRATKAANDAEIPETESAMRTNVMHAVGTLDIREHRHPIDPAEHPAGGGTLTLSNAQQWALVHHDDFSTNAEGWFISKDGVFSNENVNDKRQGCNGNPDLHLGGYCAFSGIEVSKTFNNLPAHSFVQITARVHFFDYWRGEYAFAKVNNNVVWQQSHAFCSKPFVQFCKGVDSCGDNKYSDKLSQLVKIAIPHTGSSITVSFGSSLHVDACTASWAVDDVAVWTKF